MSQNNSNNISNMYEHYLYQLARLFHRQSQLSDRPDWDINQLARLLHRQSQLSDRPNWGIDRPLMRASFRSRDDIVDHNLDQLAPDVTEQRVATNASSLAAAAVDSDDDIPVLVAPVVTEQRIATDASSLAVAADDSLLAAATDDSDDDIPVLVDAPPPVRNWYGSNIDQSLSLLLLSLPTYSPYYQEYTQYQNILRRLPTSVVQEGANQDTCVICLEDYKTGDKLTWFPCFHKYHTDCASNSIKEKPICPFCRHPIALTEAQF